MAVSIDYKLALTKLEQSWAAIDDPAIQPTQKMIRLIDEVMSARDVTFKYILVTGFLAKSINRKINARALQTRSSLKGAYDARSLCHKVVVGFEKSRGNLFGLSNEPFVNKPARHPEHDKNNPQLKNRAVAAALHDALECANRNSSQAVFAGLVYILRSGRKRASETMEALPAVGLNLRRVIEFTSTFLLEADGGSRLAAVWAAFAKLLADDEAKVVVSSPNRPDFFAKSTGDVEIFYKDVLVSASECKHRPLSADDVNHGIRKALERGCPEYLFVCAAGIAPGQEESVAEAIAARLDKLDISFIDIKKITPALAVAMNPIRRANFGSVVAAFLSEMRRFDSANDAAELWNRLES